MRSLYQQIPIAVGATNGRKTFCDDSIWFQDWLAGERVCRAMTLDPSKGRDAKFGNFSAFVLLPFMADRHCYVDAELAIRNVSVIAEMTLQFDRTFTPNGFAVETNQFDELQACKINRLATECRQFIPTFGFNNQVPKVVRIRTCPPCTSTEDQVQGASSRGGRAGRAIARLSQRGP